MTDALYSNQNILKGTLDGINDKGEINVIHCLMQTSLPNWHIEPSRLIFFSFVLKLCNKMVKHGKLLAKNIECIHSVYHTYSLYLSCNK